MPGKLFMLRHPDESHAVVVSTDGLLTKWKLAATPERVGEAQLPATVADASLFDRGERIACAVGNEILVYSFDDLKARPSIKPADQGAISAIAFSPDGRWLAVAVPEAERVSIIERQSSRVTGEFEGGERMDKIAFDPASRLLASACSFQGGGHVRIDEIDANGGARRLHELWRATVHSKPADFVDTLNFLEFSSDSTLIGLFETSAIYHEHKPPGWRGNVVVYETQSGKLRWKQPVDSSTTGDPLSLAQAGYPLGYPGVVAFANDGVLLCTSTHGCVLSFSMTDGAPGAKTQSRSDADVLGLTTTSSGEFFVALSDGAVCRGKK